MTFIAVSTINGSIHVEKSRQRYQDIVRMVNQLTFAHLSAIRNDYIVRPDSDTGQMITVKSETFNQIEVTLLQRV